VLRPTCCVLWPPAPARSSLLAPRPPRVLALRLAAPRHRPGAAPLRRAPWALAASACLPAAAVQEPRSRRPRPATRANRKPPPPLGSRRVLESRWGRKSGRRRPALGDSRSRTEVEKPEGLRPGCLDVPDSR
jgi:hypothetical protein